MEYRRRQINRDGKGVNEKLVWAMPSFGEKYHE